MANTAVSNFPETGPALSTDLLGGSRSPHAVGDDLKLTITEVLTFIQANQTTMLNLDGSAFTIVGGDANATTNGTALVDAYAAAKLATPHGAALSTSNRFTIFLLPGQYSLTGGALNLNAEFIDLVGLSAHTGPLRWANAADEARRGDVLLTSTGNTITITATGNTDLALINLCVVTTTAANFAIAISGGARTAETWRNLFLVNTGGLTNASMQVDVDFPGKYQDVRTFNQRAFGFRISAGAVSASGVFDRCKAGSLSFASALVDGFGAASGTFNECEAGNLSFGRLSAGGNFFRCRQHEISGVAGGMFGFGSGSSANGLFIDCDTGSSTSNCYGVGNTSGTFVNSQCRSGVFSAGGAGTTYSGTWIDCVGGDNSFGGGQSTFSGIARHCVGGAGSFGGSTATGGTMSGTCDHCVGGNGSFGGGVTTGGTCSGNLTHCTGGTNCFGGGGTTAGTLSGRLSNCRMSGTLNATVTGSIIESDIDGWGDVFTPPTADSTAINNTAAETNFSTNISIPLRAWKIGKIYRFELNGKYSTDAATPGTLILRVKLGTTVMALSKTFTLPAAAANAGFKIVGSITCRTTGATGTVSAEAAFFIEDNLIGAFGCTPSNGTKTVDTTAAQTFQASAQFSVADVDNSITLENIQLSPLAA
ncbi:MAG TPA: hypothetical protein VFU31_21000 [Candidatus Binatia bacterium]|nr:hypothetical protein [Candidatus Binatia bacterium]